ncbi:sensor histidine kinase [Pontivivens ytuae]|uniref:histidine kinase n=1 Tax=Pontivivens ytuae TaxID=2789856 RepID=A0A7S9LTI6_9RHOB|nr:GAF domain-containing protein [Pontivivens ytuae]QPH54730.1 GAF domain-containing protein [Pontivivens ytuae]
MTAHVDIYEEQRLRLLRATDLLDSDQQERFDRFTRLASAVTGCPMALISLVDADRQWFKSKIGLDLDETPREVAFCDHTIRQRIPLVIPDATVDPRFRDNPLVTGPPHLRFYAGAPLWLAPEQCVGSLCVLDTEPRDGLPADKLSALEDLAATLVREIRARIGAHEDLARLADQEVVIAELKHRMGNMYSNISAMIRHSDNFTLRREDFVTEIQQRIDMMAHAQRRLAERDFRSADLGGLVSDAVRDFGIKAGGGDRIRLKGIPVSVNARGAMSVALMINELGTNALKHGALSRDDGAIEVDWGRQGDRFVLSWTESGGRAAPASDRRGFGSILLREIIPQDLSGELDTGYAETGLYYRLAMEPDRFLV